MNKQQRQQLQHPAQLHHQTFLCHHTTSKMSLRVHLNVFQLTTRIDLPMLKYRYKTTTTTALSTRCHHRHKLAQHLQPCVTTTEILSLGSVDAVTLDRFESVSVVC